MSLANVYFQSPAYLLLLFVPLVLMVMRWWWSKRRLDAYCAPQLQVWMRLSDWSWRGLPWRWLSVWGLLVMAIAQPMWLSNQVRAAHQPIEWVAVVDVSASMQINDVLPSRLQQVRWALEGIAQQWQPGDRAGLVVFSGSHHWLVPMTQDKALWLSGIDLLSVDMLPLKGSLLTQTVTDVDAQLSAKTALIVLTDGGEVKPLTDVSNLLLHKGLLLSVGTTVGRIQQASNDVEMGNLALPEKAVQSACRHWGLDYQSLNTQGASAIATWLTRWREQQPVSDHAALLGESLQWVLLIVILVLWFSFGRISRQVWQGMFGSLLLVMVMYTPATEVIAAEPNTSTQQLYQQAEQALQESRYEQATQLAIETFKRSFNSKEQGAALALLGASLMKQQQWFAAGQALRGALAHDASLVALEDQLRFVMTKLPKPLDKSTDSKKAGNRFEGVVADWDEASLAWETKDVLQENRTKPKVQTVAPSVAEKMTADVSSAWQQHQQARQDWVLSGEMRQTQQEKRLFYQRLFSLEAGFAAVQDTPQALEGINPW